MLSIPIDKVALIRLQHARASASRQYRARTFIASSLPLCPPSLLLSSITTSTAFPHCFSYIWFGSSAEFFPSLDLTTGQSYLHHQPPFPQTPHSDSYAPTFIGLFFHHISRSSTSTTKPSSAPSTQSPEAHLPALRKECLTAPRTHLHIRHEHRFSSLAAWSHMEVGASSLVGCGRKTVKGSTGRMSFGT